MGFDLVRLGSIQSTDRPYLQGVGGGGIVPDTPGEIPSENLCTGSTLAYSIELLNSDASIRFGNNDTYNEIGHSIAGNGAIITCARLKVSTQVIGNGTTYLKIYAHSGTFGTSGVPTGTALATSTGLSAATLNTQNGYAIFTFPTPFQTVSGTNYFIAIQYTGDTIGGSLRVFVDTAGTGLFLGNIAYKNTSTSAWSASTTEELVFEVFGKYLQEWDSLDANTFGDQYNYLSTSENRRISQCVIGQGLSITQMRFNIRLTGSPTGTLNVRIYAMTGTFGTNGFPTGTALATSDNFNVASASSVDAEYTITFSGANIITLTAGVYYCVSLEYSGGSSSNLVGIVMNIGNSGSLHPGNAGYYNGTTWSTTTYGSVGTSGTSDDLCFYLSGY